MKSNDSFCSKMDIFGVFDKPQTWVGRVGDDVLRFTNRAAYTATPLSTGAEFLREASGSFLIILPAILLYLWIGWKGLCWGVGALRRLIGTWIKLLGWCCVRISILRQTLALRKVKVRPLQDEPVYRGHWPEAMRVGSPLTRLPVPDCQVMLGHLIEGEFSVVGCGWRYKNYLITAEHVINGAKQMVMTRDRVNFYPISTKYDSCDTDAVAILVDESVWSKLAVKVATIARERVNVFAQVVGCNGEGSSGKITRSTVFGMLDYSGSTRSGFSGAPYISGRQVVGMHVVGGDLAYSNMGYDASYLRCILPLKEESTAEWLETMVKRGKKIKAKRWGSAGDEYLVEIDGVYHQLDADVFNQLVEKGYELKPGYDDVDDSSYLQAVRSGQVVQEAINIEERAEEPLGFQANSPSCSASGSAKIPPSPSTSAQKPHGQKLTKSQKKKAQLLRSVMKKAAMASQT